MKIGEKLKEVRTRLRYSQPQFAKLINIPQQTISKFETGQSKVPYDVLVKYQELILGNNLTDIQLL